MLNRNYYRKLIVIRTFGLLEAVMRNVALFYEFSPPISLPRVGSSEGSILSVLLLFVYWGPLRVSPSVRGILL